MFCWSEKSELKTGCSFKYKRYQGKHVCPKRHVEDTNMTPSIQCSFLERFTHPSRCYSLEKPHEICHRFPYKCRKDGGHINFHHSVTRNKKIVNFYGWKKLIISVIIQRNKRLIRYIDGKLLTNGNWSLVKIGRTSQAERLCLNDLCSCSPKPYTNKEGGWFDICIYWSSNINTPTDESHLQMLWQ